MCKITAQQIITWQNEMMNHKDEQGKPYSPVYLKTVHNQLSAIFNHAVRYYNLRENPCKTAGEHGQKEKPGDVVLDQGGVSEICGGYDGQASIVLCVRDALLVRHPGGGAAGPHSPLIFDFEKGTVSINKSYQRLNGQDLITTPKTEKSNRVITMPQFLANEIQDYLKNALRHRAA